MVLHSQCWLEWKGCLTNFLPFTMACDQMAVTLEEHMALRTEVAVLI